MVPFTLKKNITHNLSVGDNISTDAGTVITKSISKQGTYIGAPARMIK